MFLVYDVLSFFFFFFNDTATTEIYTLSLHDALPICASSCGTSTRKRAVFARSSPGSRYRRRSSRTSSRPAATSTGRTGRSEEHTSELQSRLHLVCRLLLEKKKKQ